MDSMKVSNEMPFLPTLDSFVPCLDAPILLTECVPSLSSILAEATGYEAVIKFGQEALLSDDELEFEDLEAVRDYVVPSMGAASQGSSSPSPSSVSGSEYSFYCEAPLCPSEAAPTGRNHCSPIGALTGFPINQDQDNEVAEKKQTQISFSQLRSQQEVPPPMSLSGHPVRKAVLNRKKYIYEDEDEDGEDEDDDRKDRDYCSSGDDADEGPSRHSRFNPKRPFACKIPGCGKAYMKNGHLVTHMRTHTGDRPYRCSWDGCDWSFVRSDELSRHLKKHTGEKNFECPYEDCRKLFSRSDHLKAHIKVHRKRDQRKKR